MSKSDWTYVLGFFTGGYFIYIFLSGGIKLFRCKRCGLKTNNFCHKHGAKQ